MSTTDENIAGTTIYVVTGYYRCYILITPTSTAMTRYIYSAIHYCRWNNIVFKTSFQINLEARGPHHSPKKQFQSINTFAQSNDYAITLRNKISISIFENLMVDYLWKKNKKKTWVPYVLRYIVPSLVDFGPMVQHGEDNFF